MIICGAGHRPDKLGGYDDATLERAIHLAHAVLSENVTKVISGMAMGWDTALAIAAHQKGIPFIAAVPFNGFESRWSLEQQNIFHNLLDLSEKTVIVCQGDYSPWMLQKRNEWMVDNSDGVFALWDGSKGGTYNCIRYAVKQNRPVKNFWSQYEEMKL